MAKFNSQTAEHYSSGQGAGYFSLKNDKDVAQVRLMYNTADEIEFFSVHEVEVDGKRRYVNCIREYNEPIDNCPLCAARAKLIVKMFVYLYDVETGEIKIWDRGKSFFSTIASYATRNNPLVGTVTEIERNGKPNDTKTTYMLYSIESDETTIEDLPELPELLGTVVMDKTFEDLEYFVEEGEFPSSGDAEPERTPARDRAPRQEAAAATSRRTPATTTRTSTPPAAGATRRTAPKDKF